MEKIDLSFLEGRVKREIDTSDWTKMLISVSNFGNVGKSTLAEVCVEFLDAYGIEREFYTFDKTRLATFNKFAIRNKKGDIDANENAKTGIEKLEITVKDDLVNILETKSKNKILDFPSRGVDAVFGAYKNVQYYFDDLEKYKHLPYFALPYNSLKCGSTAEHVDMYLSGVETNYPITIVFYLNKGLMDNEKVIIDLYNNDNAVKSLKSKFRYIEAVTEAEFDNVLIQRLDTSKMLPLMNGGLPPYSKSNLTQFLIEAKKELFNPIFNPE